MSTRRLLITTLTLTLVIPSAADVQACWLTDWLHGNSAPVYMAGPTAAAGGATVGAGSAGGAYTAGYSPVVTSSYAAGYAPTGRTAAALPLATRSQAGADYSLQRPSYLDNPSVYTGRPTLQSSRRVAVGSSAYASGSVPLSGSLRGGSQATSSSFYGTGNIYPDTATVGGVQGSGYASARPAISTAAPTNNLANVYTAPQPRRSGLARFFGSLLGTDYRSSYYRAPVTYYRPATTVDPVTGTTVTVQRPCTSSVQQLQRTPYRSLQPASPPTSVTPAPSTSPSPSAGCQGGTLQPLRSYGTTSSTQPSLSAPANGVRPAGGYSDGDRAAPIPSTGQTYPAPSASPNTAPLTGSPPASGNGTDDRAPVEQPQLNSSQRPSASFRRETTQPRDSRTQTRRELGTTNGQSYRQSFEDDAAESSPERSNGSGGYNSNNGSNNGSSNGDRNNGSDNGNGDGGENDDNRSDVRFYRQPARDDSMATRTPPSLGARNHQGDHRSVRPIPAPADYRSPFHSAGGSADRRERSTEPAQPSTEPARRSPRAAPPLPATRPSEPAQPAHRRAPERRLSVPVREAALQRRAAAGSTPAPSSADGTGSNRQRQLSADDWRTARDSGRQRPAASRPRVTTDSSAWYSLDP